MKNWLRIPIIALTLAAAGIGVGFALKAERNLRSGVVCSKLEIEFRDSLKFVSEEDVKGFLKDHYGTYIGEQVDSIGFNRIENLLDGRSAILKSQAWSTPDGILHISLTQREPVVRFDDNGKGHYIDRNLKAIGLHPHYTAPVPVIEGPVQSDSLWLRGAVELSEFLMGKQLWPSKFVKISSDEKGRISLYPSEGEEVFIIGFPDELKTKFGKINLYCRKIRPAGNNYKSVDLRYSGQIICRQ